MINEQNGILKNNWQRNKIFVDEEVSFFLSFPLFFLFLFVLF